MSYTSYWVMSRALWPIVVSVAALASVTGNREWGERVGRTPRTAAGSVWLHAASVGEVAAVAPLDFATAVRRTLGSVGSRALLLTETELWPNTIYESTAAGLPVGAVNGRLSRSPATANLRANLSGFSLTGTRAARRWRTH